MSARRRIAVITSSRADWCHLALPLREMEARPELEPDLYVTGAHLHNEFGHTVDEIVDAGHRIAAKVPILDTPPDDRDAGMGHALARATAAFTDLLAESRPDLVLVLADRYEMLGPALAAMTLRLPIAHVEGGESSEGAIDHAIRNALTMLAHLHFVTTEDAAGRIASMGEEAWRIHRIGAASLDHLRRSPRLETDALASRLGFMPSPAPIVASFHPVTLDRDTTAEAEAFYAALTTLDAGIPVVLCHPNADAGGLVLAERARDFASCRTHVHFAPNLAPVEYWSLLRHARAIVGNSSSGIMESTSLHLPAVDVGRRQRGRVRGQNVLSVPAETAAITAALETILSAEFAARCAGAESPYGDGCASERLADILSSAPIAPLLEKTFV